MSETANRVLIASGLILILILAAWLERNGIVAATYWLGILVCAGMIFEFLSCIWRAPREIMFNVKNLAIFVGFMALLGLDFVSITTLGRRPMIILMILAIVCAADIGAWLFGRVLGGDKLWEKISENKTWTGQIAGIICGTLAAGLVGY